MEAPKEIKSPRHHTRTESAAMPDLLHTLSSFALWTSIVTLAIALVTAAEMPYLNEFLYGRGSESIPSLLFLIVSAFSWSLYLGTLTMEPVMLPAWEQASRSMGALLMLLPSILWIFICYVGPGGSALLIGKSHPYRDPDEPTGSRIIATPDASPRFTHRWLAGISPHLIYH